jgi:outer membrane immunogenic protein
MIRKTIAAAAALLATATMASAADMAVKARPVMPVEVWNWTGFYIGAHVGAGWGETESSLTGIGGGGAFFPFSQTSSSGFLGGVQAGANWQAGWAVFGVQGDIAGADINGRSPCVIVFSCETQTHWLASVTGRLGAVVLDRGLVYVKGGGAWLNTTASARLPIIAPPITIASEEITRFGWTIGLGTEWMITRNWTAFIEYDYYNFDRENFRFNIIPAPGTFANVDLKHTLSVAKVGVNYKFDWGTPVVAKY